MVGRAPDHAKNSKRPDAMTLLMKRKSSAPAHHQNRAELWGRWLLPLSGRLPRLLHPDPTAGDDAGLLRTRAGSIAVEHDAAIDLDRMESWGAVAVFF